MYKKIVVAGLALAALTLAPYSAGASKSGESIKVVNNGGEFHTFTEVEEFGGGCVPELNGPLELGFAPECEPTFPDGTPVAFAETGIPPLGGVLTVNPTSKGTHKFICLIHPWMRTEVTVR